MKSLPTRDIKSFPHNKSEIIQSKPTGVFWVNIDKSLSVWSTTLRMHNNNFADDRGVEVARFNPTIVAMYGLDFVKTLVETLNSGIQTNVKEQDDG